MGNRTTSGGNGIFQMTIHLWEIWSNYKYDFKRLSYWPSEVSVCFNLDPKTLCFWQITNLSNFPDVRTSNRVFSNHNVFIYTGRWLPSGCGVKILQLDRWVFDSCHRQKSWLSFFRNSFSNTANFSELFGPDKTSMRLKCKKSTKLKVFYFSKEKYTTECNNP